MRKWVLELWVLELVSLESICLLMLDIAEGFSLYVIREYLQNVLQFSWGE